MAAVFDAMQDFFTTDEWTFEQVEGHPILRMNFAGDSGRWTCFVQTREEQAQFIFYSRLPVNVKPEDRASMAEFITRANYGMINGNFEMDWDDGEVRYKTMIDVEGSELSHTMAKNTVYANVLTMDRYYPGLMKVIYGEVSPAEAVKSVEQA